MTDKVGGLSATKTKILSLIASADASLSPQSTHIFSNWRIDVNYMESNFPIVTVRLGTASIPESIYGRKLEPSKSGNFAIYNFSAHIWHENAETDPISKPACDLADKIIDVLEKFNGESTTSGIRYFYNITARESEPERGPQRLSRVIIEGFVIVSREL